MTNSLFGHLAMRFTSSEPAQRKLMARLLQLNYERYEEGKNAGLHEGKKPPTLLDDAALKKDQQTQGKVTKCGAQSAVDLAGRARAGRC